MDTSKAGQLIAEQMEALERDFGDKEDHQIGAMVTIVEIQGPEGSHFRMRNNIGNPVVVLGVMRMAEAQWLEGMKRPGGIERGPGLDTEGGDDE
jgi:hypothetical protein